ncbi:MAG: hypothetical protein M3P18_25330 [Actinomycetota bacterium]|nr:hypothetical protein [Actinomycetota bacterium]
MPEKKTKPPTDELDDDIFAVRVRVTSQLVHDLLGRGGFDGWWGGSRPVSAG